jgi:flagellar assembly protein FliH
VKAVAKRIFKPFEVREIGSKVLIAPPDIKPRPRPEEAFQTEERVEEVEEFKESKEQAFPALEPAPAQPGLEEERAKLLEEAKKTRDDAEAEAKRIRDEAQNSALAVLQKSGDDARKAREDARAEAEKIVAEAEKKARDLEEASRQKAIALLQETRKKAAEEGREAGFSQGKEEVERLVGRLQVIMGAAIDQKKNIIENTEKQLIDLVLLVARKVVKVISETEKKVVVENLKEALKKVGKESEIAIRVNTADLGLTTKHKKTFISMVEELKNVRIEEDSRVDPGGCIIETSFGDIDARIQTQLQVLEEKIRELVPIKG